MKTKTKALDVAAAAGVSPATVDRVLNGRGGVSAERQRLVLEWARKLNLDRNLERRPTRILRIGVLMQSPENPFYGALQRAFANANELYFGHNIQVTQYYYDVARPEEAAKLLERLPKSQEGLIVVLPDNQQIISALKRVTEKVPVITMASDLPFCGRLTYVGVDNRAAGRTAADLMGRFIGREGGDVVVVTGVQSFVDQGEREIGFRATLAQRYPQCRLLQVLEAQERPELAGALVARTLRSFPQVRGIYNLAAGDLEILNAAKQTRTNDRVVFITHELTPDRRSLLKEGLIDAVIDQNPELEAVTAVRVLANHFGRMADTPTSTRTAISIYMQENC